jgi:hypothetical protein
MPPRQKKPASHEKLSIPHSHSQGLANPGRRIPRPRSSNPSLNSLPNGSPLPPDADADSASPNSSHENLLDNHPAPSAATNGHAAHDMGSSSATSYLPQQNAVCRRVPSDVSPSDDTLALDGYNHAAPLRIDVNSAAAAADASTRQRKSVLAAAATVITSCPLWDVVALLIILLQLPPALLSVVQLLFASMDFFPAAVQTSLSNRPTLHDFHEILLGTGSSPSLQTILTVDLFILLLFIPLWTPAQNIALDLAQAVIAMSLGGAAASKGGTTNSVLCCVSIIAFSHMLRWTMSRHLGIDLFWGLVKYGLKSDSPRLSYSDRLYTPHSWPRCLLGVHILAQGVLRIVRRYLLWQAALTEASAQKKTETDRNNSPVATPRSAVPPDVLSETATSAGDGRPPGPSPSPAAKERYSGARKKKKQATEVRSHQPFWAAVASTKVAASREYEPSPAQLDARAARSVDSSDMGNVDFKSVEGNVWITDIGATDISFGVSLPMHDHETEEDEDVGWYLRVNGAAWISTKKKKLGEPGLEDCAVWEGRIYGLTPLSSYNCEFVRESDHSVIYDVTLITQPAPSTETAVALSAPAQPLQPSSPAATLRNSIAAAELDAERSRNNHKLARKLHKTNLDKLQAQIDREKARLSSTGGSDERQRQRAKQLETSILKLKADHKDAEEELMESGEIPDDEMEVYKRAKAEAKDRQRRMEAQKASHDKSKKEADKEYASAKAEIVAALNKRARFESRQKEYAAKLTETSKRKDQSALAKTFRARELLEAENKRRSHLLQIESMIAELERQCHEETKSNAATLQAIKQYEDWARLAGGASASAPGTPDGPNVMPLSAAAQHALGSISLPGSRPNSLHATNAIQHSASASASSASFAPFVFPGPIGPVSTNASASSIAAFAPPPSSAATARRRASSLEVSLSDARLPLQLSLRHQTPPSSSSAALLADSTALAPPAAPNGVAANGLVPFPAFAPNGFAGAPVAATPPQQHPVPVGAEKARRKGSTGSHGSHGSSGGNNGNAAGNDNGSPRFGKLAGLKAGSVATPPGSVVWERRGARE